MSLPARPADRYGDRRWNRRWLIPLTVLALAVVATALVVMLRIAEGSVRSSMISWQNPADDVMVATIDVARPPGTRVTCDLAARDIRQIIVGQATVEIPAASERQISLEVEIPLQGDAVAAEIQDCRAAD